MSEDVKRRYRSPLRDAQAQATREAIRRAAAERFTSAGFVATSIRTIADDAGVAPQTVYAQFGNKAAIVKDWLDVVIAGDDEPIPVAERPWFARVFDAGLDGRERLRRYAHTAATVNQRAGDAFDVIRRGADADAELAELWASSVAQRRAAVTRVVDAVVADTPLRSAVSRADAVDLLWVFHGPEIYQLVVTSCGWSIDRYEAWLAQTFVEQLLG